MSRPEMSELDQAAYEALVRALGTSALGLSDDNPTTAMGALLVSAAIIAVRACTPANGRPAREVWMESAMEAWDAAVTYSSEVSDG